MRVLVQRSNQASVEIDGNVVGKINNGLVLLVGFTDVMFKAIMYKHKNILAKLLEEILEIKINNIEYLNIETPLKQFIEKGKKLDLYIETTDTYVDVEVSIKPSKYIINRNLSYAF